MEGSEPENYQGSNISTRIYIGATRQEILESFDAKFAASSEAQQPLLNPPAPLIYTGDYNNAFSTTVALTVVVLALSAIAYVIGAAEGEWNWDFTMPETGSDPDTGTERLLVNQVQKPLLSPAVAPFMPSRPQLGG